MTGLLWALVGCQPPPLERTEPAPVLQVDAEGFDFDALKLGEQATQTLTVTNAGDLELGLELSLEGSPDFSVPSVNRPYFLEPEESRTFDVSFSPSAPWSEGLLVLTSDDPDRPELALPMTGAGALPVLEVSPLEHDFGSVGLHCQESLVVSLANTGDADLTIIGGADGGLGFGLEPVEVPVLLAPDAWMDVTITVALRELGPASGQLFVVSDAASGQIVANQSAQGDELIGGCD